MNRDQKFFDLYSLVIGVLALFALGILVLALWLSNRTQGVYIEDSEEYQSEINERIQPLSQVYLPGEQHQSTSPTLTPAEDPEPVATAMTGPQVYNSACIACHGNGVGNAPIVGDTAAWEARIAKGTDVLYDHAINGFNGEVGVMIAKGGRMDLSDQEVREAVDYMVAESQ